MGGETRGGGRGGEGERSKDEEGKRKGRMTNSSRMSEKEEEK